MADWAMASPSSEAFRTGNGLSLLAPLRSEAEALDASATESAADHGLVLGPDLTPEIDALRLRLVAEHQQEAGGGAAGVLVELVDRAAKGEMRVHRVGDRAAGEPLANEALVLAKLRRIVEPRHAEEAAIAVVGPGQVPLM